MKSLLLISCFILSFLSLRAQVNHDSLQKVIQSNRPYEERINASITLLGSLETRDFDATIEEGEKALALARKNKDSIAVAEVKRHIGGRRKEPRKSASHSRQAVRQFCHRAHVF